MTRTHTEYIALSFSTQLIISTKLNEKENTHSQQQQQDERKKK